MPTQLSPKVLSWATDIEENTANQARISAEMPFVDPHVALMPDAHFGYGATVGSVIPTKGAIMPSAVGVDIGCGMIAAKLGLTASDLPDDLGYLHQRIAMAVPSGMGKGHHDAQNEDVVGFPEWPVTANVWGDKWRNVAMQQFGSLGGGNHFIELCLDESDNVWLVLHSGSRGIGNKIAQKHIDGAKGLMKRMFITLEEPDLAYFVEGTPEFQNYITDMLWAQDYAMGNRQRMLTAVLNQMMALMNRVIIPTDVINCHHNFTQMEHHMNRNLWITRKGAIQARVGDRGVIPGSMGAASFIVSGKGNPASFSSCSHGAGRKMSRNQAKRELDLETLRESMKDIVWNGRPGARQGEDKMLLDEDPRAYKDIDEVMAAQDDLVTIEHRLHQILNYKGTG
jgi:tRNA-splicing ligase RtcB